MEDEQPLRFLRHIVVVIANVVFKGIRDHERRMHALQIPPEPCWVVPFPEDRIPDVVLAQMDEILESLETRDFGISVVAKVFDYPEPLIRRELAGYRARFRHFIKSRA